MNTQLKKQNPSTFKSCKISIMSELIKSRWEFISRKKRL